MRPGEAESRGVFFKGSCPHYVKRDGCLATDVCLKEDE